MNNYYQRNKYVSFLETVEEGENIWVANLCFNGLFKLKKNGNDAEYVCSFEMDNMTTSGTGLYSNGISYKRKIFFLPYNASNIAVVDIDTEEIKYIYLPQAGDASGYMTAGYALYEGYLYLFSQFAQYDAVRIHMETFEIEKLQKWNKLNENYYDEKRRYMTAAVIQADDNVWLGINNTNKILKYSLKDGTYEEIESEKKIIKALGNTKLNELYCISHDGYNIECINLADSGSRNYIDLSNFIEKGNRILHILSDEETLAAIPFYGEYVVIVDRKSGGVIKHQIFPEEFKSYNESDRFFYMGRLTEECIELFPYFSNGLIKIHRRSGETKYYKTEIKWKDSADDLVWKCHYHNSINKSICFERICSLEGFLDILGKDAGIDGKTGLDENSGKKIERYILGD